MLDINVTGTTRSGHDAMPPKKIPSRRPERSGRLPPVAKALPAQRKRVQRATSSAPPAPDFVEPMAAKVVAQLPDSAEWLYELKLDGYRAFGIKHGDAVRVISRNDKNLAGDFPGVAAALKTLRAESVMLDGEIVALDVTGKPSFQLLQNRKSSASAIVYYAFDLLSLEGEDWRPRPLHERKAKLQEVLTGSDVRVSASFDGPAAKIVAAVQSTTDWRETPSSPWRACWIGWSRCCRCRGPRPPRNLRPNPRKACSI
jgi:ATP-dependent DNA ligase